MPRVIIERDFDFRVRRGLIRSFKRAETPLVLSQAETDAIVAAGAGRVVERGETALPFGQKKPRRPRKPSAAPEGAEGTEGES